MADEKGSDSSLAVIGAVIGVALIGVGVYLWKKATTPPGKQILAGGTAGLKFTWKNNGLASFQPEFRLQVLHSGLIESWHPGEWLAGSELNVSARENLDIQVDIPGDWTKGTIDIKLTARIPDLTGEEEILRRNGVFYIL